MLTGCCSRKNNILHVLHHILLCRWISHGVFSAVIFAWSTVLSACGTGESAFPHQKPTSVIEATPIQQEVIYTLSAVQQLTSPLFVESNRQIPSGRINDPTIIRYRYVDVMLDVLDESEIGEVILLNLFENAVYVGKLEDRQSTQTGYTWVGTLEGVKQSRFTLVIGGNQIAGNITLPNTFYQVRYVDDGLHAIYQIDQSAFPPEDEPHTTGE